MRFFCACILPVANLLKSASHLIKALRRSAVASNKSQATQHALSRKASVKSPLIQRGKNRTPRKILRRTTPENNVGGTDHPEFLPIPPV